MIVELVGLPGAGKTKLAEALEARGATVVRGGSPIRLLMNTLLFACKHPFLSLSLTASLFRHAPAGMRYSLYMNGYLVSASKWEQAQRLSRRGKTAVIDQGHMQLIVSLPSLPQRLISRLPKPDILAVVDAPAAVRGKRMQERGRIPRITLGEREMLRWERSAEAALARAMPSLRRCVAEVREIDGITQPKDNAANILSGICPQPSRAPHMKRAVLFLCVLLSTFLPRRGAAVLMYHAVDHSGWKLSIPPLRFAAQMRYLARRHSVVPLSDVILHSKGEKQLPDRAVAITFDDGYHDLVMHVLPILRTYNIPATLFLTTDLTVQTAPLPLPRITEEDLAILRESGLVSIESHGTTHPHLSRLSEQEARKEMKDARQELKKKGFSGEYFAYPFGDRAPFVENAVREVGHVAAFSITEGFVYPGDDIMRLKRIQVDATMLPWMFRARLTSALTLNRVIVDFFRRTA